MRRYGVVVIGGGASGALAAIQLAAIPGEPVALVEERSRCGPGVAYGTDEPWHVLNTRAGAMSALPERPGHFLAWCTAGGRAVDSDTFAPRRWYGEYLEAVLGDATRQRRPLYRIHGRAVGLRVDAAGQIQVALREGTPLRAGRVVLALGHAPPTHPAFVGRGTLGPRRYVGDPWQPEGLSRVPAGGPVLLVGTGLTAVDVALSLARRNHSGPIVAVSRHGLLPAAHVSAASEPAAWTAPAWDACRSVRALLAELRRAVSAAGQQRLDWRHVVDSLRPVTETVWHGLPLVEQQRFLRHVVRFWEIHRHRMAPTVARTVAAMTADDRLRIVAGSVRRCQVVGRDVVATVHLRHGRVRSYRFAAVVNCTGPGALVATHDPLVRSLLDQGLARREPLGLGFDVDSRGALVGDDGTARPALTAIGPVRRGRSWETTAIPEIRVQASALADVLAASA